MDLCMVGFQPARPNQGRSDGASRGEGLAVGGWLEGPAPGGGGVARGRASQREGTYVVVLQALTPGQIPS